MDLRLTLAEPTADERAAVDACLGPPTSQWDGGNRDAAVESRSASGGRELGRARRNLLLPALQAVQRRFGWITEGALIYVCERLDVPPAEAYGVATFYALLATTPRPRRILHVCDDIACQCRGATEMIAELGLAMTLEATYEEIEATIHAHPTLSESVHEAAGQAFGHAIHL